MLLLVAKSLQSCPALCDPIDSSPPGSAVPRILQARTLEWAETYRYIQARYTHTHTHTPYLTSHFPYKAGEVADKTTPLF